MKLQAVIGYIYFANCLLSVCLHDFDRDLLSEDPLSFVMLSLYSEYCRKDAKYTAVSFIMVRHTVQKQSLRQCEIIFFSIFLYTVTFILD